MNIPLDTVLALPFRLQCNSRENLAQASMENVLLAHLVVFHQLIFTTALCSKDVSLILQMQN